MAASVTITHEDAENLRFPACALRDYQVNRDCWRVDRRRALRQIHRAKRIRFRSAYPAFWTDWLLWRLNWLERHL
jgi:hypothetical protein